MELFSILLLIVGGGTVRYLDYYARKSTSEQAHREARYIRTVEAIDYELRKLDTEFKRIGVISNKDLAFINALYARRFYLEKIA